MMKTKNDQDVLLISINSFHHSREEVSEFFDKMDRDFDGRLSFGEFMGEETPLEKVFKSMDKDGDGTVTKEVRLEVEEDSILVL